jgi:hypothetical protein
MTSTEKSTEAAKVLQSLSARDFLSLGVNHIAYIKSVMLNDRPAWSVNAADGKALSVHLTEQAAAAAARQNHLLSVHTH